MSLSASLKTRLGELTEAWNNLTAEDFVDNFFSLKLMMFRERKIYEKRNPYIWRIS